MSAKAKYFHNLVRFQSSSAAKAPDYTLTRYSATGPPHDTKHQPSLLSLVQCDTDTVYSLTVGTDGC